MIAAFVCALLIIFVASASGTKYITVIKYYDAKCHTTSRVFRDFQSFTVYGTNICVPLNHNTNGYGSVMWVAGYSGDEGYLRHQFFTDTECSNAGIYHEVETWSKSDLGECVEHSTHSYHMVYETSTVPIPRISGYFIA